MKRLALLLAMSPLLMVAHPGHGPVDHGPAHYLITPEHLLGTLMVAILAFGVYRLVRSGSKKNA
ncbi:MAG: hypothetical protein LPK80_06710 [Bacteroidota bacterium]|nr:hypothetical protein [Bacteroidota bacterium]MDX5405151.1 hypothetical protein [Bacteroidota bacterium]MDX5427262.1 hypothetical protein [Bacteroidota bacterium]MDX5448042.1 hypothetical protein [Bacteroidota bacterium]MDX5505214.1 hypothetical protein [Bacteroidota bacterium]